MSSYSHHDFHQIKYRPHNWLVVRMASLKYDALDVETFKTAEDVLQVPEFKKIMWACQPQLMQKFTNQKLHGDPKAIRNIFLKYLLRCLSSSIPRKLFAGYSLAKVGSGFQIETKSIEHWQAIQVQTPKFDVGFYYFNPSIYFVSGYMHLKTWNADQKSFLDHSLRLAGSVTNLIQELSQQLKQPLTKAQLKQRFKKYGVDPSQSEIFFNWLLQIGVLLPERKSNYKVSETKIFKHLEQSDTVGELELQIEYKTEPIVDNKFILKAASAATDVIQLMQVQLFLSLTRSSISEFKRSAVSYLGGREVPLLEMVDTHSEIYFKKTNLRLANEVSNALSLIQAKVIESLSQTRAPVKLTREDLQTIKEATKKQWPQLESRYRFPHSISVFVEKGPHEMPIIRRIEGGSFLAAFSRYAYYSPPIAAEIKKSFEILQQELNDDVIYAVPSYVDFTGQLTGILQSFYPKVHVIRINEPCRGAMDLSLSDLLVSLTSTGFVLRSKSLQKKIVVIAGHLLNEGLISDITFDFLHSLGLYESFKTINFSAFPFPVPYVPRIEIPSAILSLAVWKLWGQDLKRIAAQNSEGLKAEFVSRHIPMKFNWKTVDQKIFIDLDKVYLCELFHAEIKKQEHIVLEEFIEPQSNRATDFIVPLFLDSAKIHHPLSNNLETSVSAQRNQYLSIDQEIISFEIYLPAQDQHDFLKNQMAKLIGTEKSYFFIRYSDPTEGFHFRLRIRNSPAQLRKLASRLMKKLEILQEKGEISHYKLVPFTPEYQRYGGTEGIQIFYKESQWQSQVVLAAAEGGLLETSEQRILFATFFAKKYFDQLNTIGLDPKTILRDQFKRRSSSTQNHNPSGINPISEFGLKSKPIEAWINNYLKKSKVKLLSNLNKIKTTKSNAHQNYFHSYIHMFLNRSGASFHTDQDDAILKNVLKLLQSSE